MLGKKFIKIAGKSGMTVRPCAEGDELTLYGADCSGCMTVNTFETALHVHIDVPKRKTNQRNGQCACLLGVDIGAYDTCGHLCKYCYANSNTRLVKENMKKHSPDTELCTTMGFYTVADGDNDIKVVVIYLICFSVRGSCCKICNN